MAKKKEAKQQLNLRDSSSVTYGDLVWISLGLSGARKEVAKVAEPEEYHTKLLAAGFTNEDFDSWRKSNPTNWYFAYQAGILPINEVDILGATTVPEAEKDLLYEKSRIIDQLAFLDRVKR